MALAAVEGLLARQVESPRTKKQARRRSKRAALRIEPTQLSVHAPVPGRPGGVVASGVWWPSRDDAYRPADLLRPLRASSRDDAPGTLSASRIRVTAG